ncbi:MAG: membrane protein insertase YidC [Rikenellaceae bacterium]
MNKNTIIGLILIGGILFGFSAWNSSKVEAQKELQAKEQAVLDSIARANAPVVSPEEILMAEAQRDSIAAVQKAAALGSFMDVSKGAEEFITLENDLAVYTFSNKGGRIASVELKDYTRLNKENVGEKVLLFGNEGNTFGFDLYAPQLISTSELFFEARKISDLELSYRLYADSARVNYVEYLYTLPQDNYMINFSADFSAFKDVATPARQPEVTLKWSVVSPKEEKGFTNENNYTTIAYKYPGEGEEIEELSVSTGSVSEEVPTKVQWVAFKQQFFSSIIVAKDNFSSAKMGYNTYNEKAENIKDFSTQLTLPYTAATGKYDFEFYFGPNKFSILEEYGKEYNFEELVPLGWGIFGWVNEWVVIPVFDFLSRHITNFGIIILLLTIFIKVLIFPLTYKSYLSTAKMRLLSPEIKKINERFPKKEDAMKKSQATMALYKSAGVSPMGGCIPMLIQFPILIAMFRFFPSSIELRGQSFLWASDLSSYDSVLDLPFSIPLYGDHVSLFTLLMAISLFITQKINMNQQGAQANQMPGMKFMMLYMMPIMLLLVFNSYSSGLAYYYLLSNIITIGQTYAVRGMVSDEKLHAQMQSNTKKPVKKSKWSERLEEMQRQQQAMKEQQKKGGKR